MKKLLTITFLLLSVYAIGQTPPFPNKHTTGSPTTLEVFDGAAKSRWGWINAVYNDTTAANLNAYLKNYPGAQIFADNKLWIRSEDAQYWIDITGSGSGASSRDTFAVQYPAIAKPDAIADDVRRDTIGVDTGLHKHQLATGGRVKHVIDSLGAKVWRITGNAGTTAGTNFIGTTDNIDLIFKRNSTSAGLIGAVNTYFGLNAGTSSSGGTFYGLSAGQSSTNNQQSGFGIQALLNSSGDRSTGFGYQSGVSNTGAELTAIGFGAGGSNTGINSTFLGGTSGVSNSGDSSIGVGYKAAYSNIYKDIIAIGVNSTADSASQLALKAGIYHARVDFGQLTEDVKYRLPNASGRFVLSVNGVEPDVNGNVTVSGGGIPYSDTTSGPIATHTYVNTQIANERPTLTVVADASYLMVATDRIISTKQWTSSHSMDLIDGVYNGQLLTITNPVSDITAFGGTSIYQADGSTPFASLPAGYSISAYWDSGLGGWQVYSVGFIF